MSCQRSHVCDRPWVSRGSLLWPLVAFVTLCACDRQSPEWEGVEIASSGCSGYDPPSNYVEIAIRVQQLDERDPTRFMLSIKLMNEGTRPVPLEDPRVLASDMKPDRLTDPLIEDFPSYPPVMLRVGELNSSGELAGQWTVLLPNLSAHLQPQNAILEPGASVELSFLWMAHKPGTYVLQGASDLFGTLRNWESEPRCQGAEINPICYAQALTEFHVEVPPP